MKLPPILISLIFFFSFCFICDTTHLYAASLVGEWSFEENSGSTVFDQSGFGNNGQLTGATRSAGKVGQGLLFDGSGGVTVPNSPSLDSLPDGFTMEAWIMPTGFPLGNSDYGSIYYKTDRNNRVDMLHFQVGDNTSVPTSVGRLYGAMNQEKPNGGFEAIAPRTVDFNEWHFVAWTYDDHFARFYDNGIDVFDEAFTDPWVGNHYELEIGQDHQLPTHANFIGYIDEAKIYNGALTQDEILRDMNPAAVPEPTTLLLLASGLLGLPFLRRKR